jgi:cyclin B
MKSMNITSTTIDPSVRHVVHGKAKPVTNRNRDPLSNITNAKKSSDTTLNPKKHEKIPVKTKNPKRPSTTQANLLNEEKAQKVKKCKSDPMILDEEETTVAASTTVVAQPLVYEDIDVNDFDDPQAVVDYVNEIYQYLMIKERDRVDPRYLTTQVDINEKMRAILVDWLVEVHRMFKLLPETLYLGVSIIDRFLSLKQISRDTLQLVGITSMLIASKYEEIYAPECNDFVYISDGAYTKPQILHMEQNILNTLNFNITHPSALHFLRRYSKAGGSDYTLHTICKYLIEVVLIDVKFLKFPPSLQASASVYLGRAMTGKSPLWTPTLEHYSTYAENVVRECAVEMNELLKKSSTSSLKAIRKKYSLAKFGQVADLPLVEL